MVGSTGSANEKKDELRTRMRTLYAQHGTTQYTTEAARLVGEHELFRASRSVLAYIPIPKLEIPFIEMLMQEYPSKLWYVPEVVSDEEMLFVRYMPSMAVPKTADIEATESELYRLSPDTCVLVPSLALTKDGARLGKGGGYYDRFLHSYPALIPRTISVVPDYAMLESIPIEGHDVRVNCAMAVYVKFEQCKCVNFKVPLSLK